MIHHCGASGLLPKLRDPNERSILDLPQEVFTFLQEIPERHSPSLRKKGRPRTSECHPPTPAVERHGLYGEEGVQNALFLQQQLRGRQRWRRPAPPLLRLRALADLRLELGRDALWVLREGLICSASWLDLGIWWWRAFKSQGGLCGFLLVFAVGASSNFGT